LHFFIGWALGFPSNESYLSPVSGGRRRLLFTLGAVALLGGGLYLRRQMRPAQKVDYAVLARHAVERMVTSVNQGTVQAKRHVSLPVEVPARVLELPIPEGSRVHAGDVLVKLDGTEAGLALAMERRRLAAAAAELARARGHVASANRELERLRRMKEQGVATAAQVDQAQDLADEADDATSLAARQVDLAREELRMNEITLEKHTLVAPFDGILAKLDLTVGEYPPGVSSLAGAAGLAPSMGGAGAPPTPSGLGAAAAMGDGAVQIVDPSEIYVEAVVDETDLRWLRAGQRVRLTVAALGDTVVEGRLRALRPIVEARSDRSRDVTITVDVVGRGHERLWVGMSADVEIVVDERPNALALPTSLVLRERGKQYVWVFDEGRLRRRTVRTGLANWKWTEIVSGLREGDRVARPHADRPFEEGAKAAPRREIQ
jgi:HlyD family secretion protein